MNNGDLQSIPEITIYHVPGSLSRDPLPPSGELSRNNEELYFGHCEEAESYHGTDISVGMIPFP